MYEVDKSKQTKTLNAYVNGIGPTKRIVMWDTLLAEMTEDEVLSVMGHEMAHATLRHGSERILLRDALGDRVDTSPASLAAAARARRSSTEKAMSSTNSKWIHQLEAAMALYEGALSTGHTVGPANTIQYALAGAGQDVSPPYLCPDRASGPAAASCRSRSGSSRSSAGS